MDVAREVVGPPDRLRGGEVEDHRQPERGPLLAARPEDLGVELRRAAAVVEGRSTSVRVTPSSRGALRARALSRLEIMFWIWAFPGLSSSTAWSCSLASASRCCARHQSRQLQAFVRVAIRQPPGLEAVDLLDGAERPLHELLAEPEHAPVPEDRIARVVRLDLPLEDASVVQREHRG